MVTLHLTMPHKKEPPWFEGENALMAKAPLHAPDQSAEIFRQRGFNRAPTAVSWFGHGGPSGEKGEQIKIAVLAAVTMFGASAAAACVFVVPDI
jgi:hypothetical protein